MAELEWRANTGKKPEDIAGERVRVKLRHSGEEPKYDNHWNPMAPPGWAVDTTRWSLRNDPFDVVEFAVL